MDEKKFEKSDIFIQGGVDRQFDGLQFWAESLEVLYLVLPICHALGCKLLVLFEGGRKCFHVCVWHAYFHVR